MNDREELQAYLNRSTVGFGKNTMYILSISVKDYMHEPAPFDMLCRRSVATKVEVQLQDTKAKDVRIEGTIEPVVRLLKALDGAGVV